VGTGKISVDSFWHKRPGVGVERRGARKGIAKGT
jgi:hypothetical protein